MNAARFDDSTLEAAPLPLDKEPVLRLEASYGPLRLRSRDAAEYPEAEDGKNGLYT